MQPNLPAEWHERDLPLVPWLEAHGGPGRYVEALAERHSPVKIQGAVDLEEMKVRTDLDGPVTGIPHREAQPGTPRIDLDWIRSQDIAAYGSAHIASVSQQRVTGWARGQ
jgi:hypothetical protein